MEIDSDTNLEMTLPPIHTTIVKVQDVSGNPIAGAKVSISGFGTGTRNYMWLSPQPLWVGGPAFSIDQNLGYDPITLLKTRRQG